MSLSQQQIKLVNPEPAIMPFHTRLLGKDRLALYSFIYSLNTNYEIQNIINNLTITKTKPNKQKEK